MHPTHALLYDRLVRFPIDGGDPALRFEARLAQEQRWTPEYARRVTDEYRKFLLLAVTDSEPVTPSRPVDEAWHLHLTYTRSYWDRLCGEVLGRPLHHDPTRGGAAESAKFRDQYERTLAAYRLAFGAEPPANVWPPATSTPSRPTHRRKLLAVVGFALALLAVGCGLAPGDGLLWLLAIASLGLFGLFAVAIRAACQSTRPRRRRSSDGGSSAGWFGGAASGCGSDGSSGDAGSGGCGDAGAGCGGGGGACGGGGGGCGGGGS